MDRPQFATVRLREGYAIEDVDEFVDRALAALSVPWASGSLTPDDIRYAEFATVRLRLGYDEEEVDAWCDEVERRLREARGEPEPPKERGRGWRREDGGSTVR